MFPPSAPSIPPAVPARRRGHRLRHLWCLVAGLAGGCAAPSVKTRPPECHLPPRTREASPRFVLPARVHYLQHDARWAADPIGGSGKPLQNVGCAICSLSMALAQYNIDCTPGELNTALKQSNGYNENGWVYWNAIVPLTGGQVHVDWKEHPTHRDITAALALGQPVVVKVSPPGMPQHWVLLVGRDGREFLMKDPLNKQKTLQPLSSHGSEILAVRIVKKG